MNTKTSINAPEEQKVTSIFPDGRKIDGTQDIAQIWSFLRSVFIEMGEKSGDKLYVKHVPLQNLLMEHQDDQDLEKYLADSGYKMLHDFTSLEELKHYLQANKDLQRYIKSGKYHIGLSYLGNYPVSIILAEKNPHPEVQEEMTEAKKAVSRALSRH